MVTRIKGFYEYDDDDLTPGKKKEGGLHQNLFDSDGNLKGNARFVPDEEQVDKTEPPKRQSATTRPNQRRGKARRHVRTSDEARHDATPDPEVIHETIYVHETVYVSAEEYEPRQAREREENERQAREREEIAKLIADAVGLLVTAATPHAMRLWHEKARPIIEARRAKTAARKAGKAQKAGRAAARPPIVVEGTVVDSGRELVVAEEVYRKDMRSVEAQARYLAALAARAFSDEQMKPVSSVNIVYGDGLADLQRTLAGLPPQQVKGIIEAAEANPPALNGDLLAELGELLGLDQVERQAIPIDKQRGRRWNRH